MNRAAPGKEKGPGKCGAELETSWKEVLPLLYAASTFEGSS